MLQADLETIPFVEDMLIEPTGGLENHQQDWTESDPRTVVLKGFHHHAPLCLNNRAVYQIHDVRSIAGRQVMRLLRVMTGRERVMVLETSRSFISSILLVLAMLFLQACGLVYDVVRMLHPLERDELSTICEHGRVRVGISFEAARPFIFPPIHTEDGIRITGLDIELIREITDTLTAYCGGRTRIVSTIHPTHLLICSLKWPKGNSIFLFLLWAAHFPGPDLRACGFRPPIFMMTVSQQSLQIPTWRSVWGLSFESRTAI